MGEMDPRILLAEMLIGLGITTYENIKNYFTQNSTDDAELAALLAEVDARIARRQALPTQPSATTGA